jgi:hypothetical protein
VKEMVELNTPLMAMEVAIAKVAELDELASVAMKAGDLATVLSIGGNRQDALKEIVKAQHRLDNEAIELSQGDRDYLANNITSFLSSSDTTKEIAKAIATGTLIVHIDRTESGFDSIGLHVSLSDAANATLTDIVHNLVVETGANEVASAKRINIKGIDATIDANATRRVSTTSSGNGGSNKGWSNGSETIQLGEVFAKFATNEDLSAYEAAKGQSNPQYAIRTKVAKASGYSKVN